VTIGGTIPQSRAGAAAKDISVVGRGALIDDWTGKVFYPLTGMH
jgi:hypothetical protein